MSKVTRSARGTFVDFELLSIKSQLAAKPIPKKVDDRRLAIEEKEGVKPTPSAAVNELLKMASDAATISKTAPKRK